MTDKLTSRHEAFAQGLAKGLTADQAYEAAGYKQHRRNAPRMSANENILARVDELIWASAKRVEIDIARTLKELVRIGTPDIRNALTLSGSLTDPQEWNDDCTGHCCMALLVVA